MRFILTVIGFMPVAALVLMLSPMPVDYTLALLGVMAAIVAYAWFARFVRRSDLVERTFSRLSPSNLRGRSDPEFEEFSKRGRNDHR